MTKVHPKLNNTPPFCVEEPAKPSGIIIFGASGDLTKRKIIPAIYQLKKQDLLSDRFYILGCGRTELSDEQFKQTACEAIKDDQGDSEDVGDFCGHCYYLSGNYDELNFYDQISENLEKLDHKYQTGRNHIFYLSLPPTVFPVVTDKLKQSNLTEHPEGKPSYPRIVIEKPFGQDFETATDLNNVLHKNFSENQIYRIDHYLGKETVQNILMFRFANTVFEPIWNRNYIDNIQITIAESLGVEHRAGYYDRSGALRDMFQNHIMQILCLIAMEPPSTFKADPIRDEKVKLLSSIHEFDKKMMAEDIVRGQYTAGTVDGQQVPGYTDEQNIPKNSLTETYVSAKVGVDNWRWKDVPFYLRTGKRLAKKVSTVAITFKKVPHSMFASSGIDSPEQNVLLIRIQPQEGISFKFQAKRPGSKTCMGTINMDFDYSTLFGVNPPDAYSRLLLDVMTGDQTLFARSDELLKSWKLFTPVLNFWKDNKDIELHKYPAGSDGLSEKEKFMHPDHEWLKL